MIPHATSDWRSARIIVLVGVGLVGLVETDSAVAQDDDYIYCTKTGGDEYSTFDTYYYTAVFRGDYGYTLGYKNDFHSFLEGNRPDLFYRHSYCFYEETREDAEAAARRNMAARDREGYRVVGTNWAPNAAGRRADEFSSRPIGDFHISVPSSPYDVQVCVRDHECEDGDRVRVSVNGTQLLGGEIVNEWSCRAVSLGEGRHDIELYAVNGTGYKGDCSYLDGNTGEVRVTGQDSQTQSWRHRGGKGSSANITVTVR